MIFQVYRLRGEPVPQSEVIIRSDGKAKPGPNESVYVEDKDVTIFEKRMANLVQGKTEIKPKVLQKIIAKLTGKALQKTYKTYAYAEPWKIKKVI